jgi:DNA-binding HxlR family transcriptional regulator
MKSRPFEGPFSATCPTRELLDQLSDKWAVLVLLALTEGPVRFNALKRQIQGITQKMLGQTLRRLERNGLVQRSVLATMPVAVEYAVTPLGRSLYGIVDALRHWAIDHIAQVSASRVRFDAREVAAGRPARATSR